MFKEYMLQSSFHGAKYVVDTKRYNIYERVFWAFCIVLSWVGSVFLIRASLDAFNNNGKLMYLLHKFLFVNISIG